MFKLIFRWQHQSKKSFIIFAVCTDDHYSNDDSLYHAPYLHDAGAFTLRGGERLHKH